MTRNKHGNDIWIEMVARSLILGILTGAACLGYRNMLHLSLGCYAPPGHDSTFTIRAVMLIQESSSQFLDGYSSDSLTPMGLAFLVPPCGLAMANHHAGYIA